MPNLYYYMNFMIDSNWDENDDLTLSSRAVGFCSETLRVAETFRWDPEEHNRFFGKLINWFFGSMIPVFSPL